jgi:outer membrane receptor protein involved in Fe transport
MNVNANFYFYGKQTFLHNKMYDIGRYKDEYLPPNNETYNYEEYSSVYTIDPKIIVNLKVSYKVFKESSVFINARNLLNSSSREFAFLDEVNGMYLIGLDINF